MSFLTRARAGAGLACLAALGIAVGNTGTAFAATQWEVQVINSDIPSGTGSVQVQYDGDTGCAKINTSSKTTTVGTKIDAGQKVTLTPFADTRCAGSKSGAIFTYSFSANQDVKENNLNCKYVAVGLMSTQHAFRVCS